MDLVAKKTQQVSQLEIELDREKKSKREFEKQLKESRRETDEARFLLKTGEMSTDQLRRGHMDLTKKCKSLEDELRKLMKDIKTIE